MNTQDVAREEMKQAFLIRFVEEKDHHNAGVSIDGIINYVLTLQQERYEEQNIEHYPVTIKKLGKTLAALLDDDSWNNVEPILIDIGNKFTAIQKNNKEEMREVIEKIKENKTEQSDEDFEGDYDDQMEAYQQKGYNEAVNDVVDIINKKIQNLP